MRRSIVTAIALLLHGASSAIAQVSVNAVRKVTSIETSYPFWSPDGSRFVFQSDRDGNSEIYTSRTDQRDLQRLTEDPGDDLTPAWSPDGRRIVFQSNRTGNTDLYLVNTDGTGLRNLTSHPSEDAHPKWSPDGAHIIFNSNRGADSTNEELYEFTVETGELRKLTSLPGWDTYPSISPDGQRVAWRRVTSEPGFDGGLRLINRNSEIFVMARGGTDQLNATSNAAFDGWPDWSADGEWIAFASNRSGRFQIHVMRPDGTGVQQLTDGAGDFTKPIWSPDGRRIVCTRTIDGNVEIFVIDLA